MHKLLGRAPRVPLPAFVPPQLATRVDAAPSGEAWLHEQKLDGYRMLARIEAARRQAKPQVQLLTRRDRDWTERMPALARALAKLPARATLIDGEVVALDARGHSDFQRLQNSLAIGREAELVYYAFDLLHLDGEDLRNLPLIERKRLLQVLIGEVDPRVRYSEHVVGQGRAVFEQACAQRAEGIVSKRAAAAYSSQRTRNWLKVKCVERQEFVIGGFTDPGGTRGQFGALLLGTHDERGRLRYAGRVGSGFTQTSLLELAPRLRKLEQDQPPFVDPPHGAGALGVRWVRPSLVAEIEYAEQTRDGQLRHASFQGLRQDKPARSVTAERALPR